MRVKLLTLVILCSCLCLASCTSEGPGQVPPKSVADSSPSPATAASVPGCPHAPSASRPRQGGSSEIEATATGGTAWALVEGGTPVPVKDDFKIIWRVTGGGHLSLVAVDGARDTLRPLGVEPHSGSDWHRPGDEWGTAWNLPQPGCWDVHVERGSTTGDIWLIAS